MQDKKSNDRERDNANTPQQSGSGKNGTAGDNGNMPSPQEYSRMTRQASPPSPTAQNLPRAFVVGGLICCIGQALTMLYSEGMGMELTQARGATSMTLIFAAGLLTSLGWFAPIARFAGAGTLVPITGFANAMVSPAMEFKSEGYIFGTGAKIFTIAGPVIVYGVSASVVYGVVYWITTLF